MTGCEQHADQRRAEPVVLRAARYAKSGEETRRASMLIEGGRVECIFEEGLPRRSPGIGIDLDGYVLLPGLINAHDHLEFALYPRLGTPPYGNYVEWGEDIHQRCAEVIAQQHAIPLSARLWWGGIRNLLCGATTVCHHNPLRPELKDPNFPVRVVDRYGWAHSFALGGDLRRARAATPAGAAFILHAGEGTDARAEAEVGDLDRLGLLDERTVLVHGLALDARGVELMRSRRASLIVCPSSNDFLFQRLPDISLLSRIPNLALGNDSPLTATGDLLDEIRFAVRRCAVPPGSAWQMVTTAPAAVLRLENGEGRVTEGGVADLIAIRDTGLCPAESLAALSASDIELVMTGGRVQLASDRVLEHLPASVREGLEPLWAGGVLRWLRAPVVRMLRTAEAFPGNDAVSLGGKSISFCAPAEMAHAR